MSSAAAKMRFAVLVASLLIVKGVPSQTQDLELTLGRETTFRGTGDACGELSCRVKGNAVSIEIVSVSVTEASGESRQLLGVTSTIPVVDLSKAEIRGNGTLASNLASIYLDLFERSVCVSGYFTCEVTYTKPSGERKSQFASAGPGHPPSPQVAADPSQYLISRPADTCSSELCQLKDKINEVKFESLDGRVNQMLDTMNSVDISSRVSRLEDRVSTLLLSHPPASEANTTSKLEDLERRVAALGASEVTPQAGDQPEACERGMGDDVNRSYQPYVTLTHSTLQNQVLCDTHTDGGGWIVIQRRARGDVDFKRDWTAYRNGFGSVTGDFWMGNEAIHTLTDQHPYELRVDFRIDGQKFFAYASSFRLESETNKYLLRLGTCSGTADTTGLTTHNNRPFSTFDRDNDAHSSNCAQIYNGGWWYNACHHSNLNGRWGQKSTPGVTWRFGNSWRYPTFTEMKMRRVSAQTSG